MKLPVYTFWELVRCIDRIRANEDARLLALLSNAFAGNPKKYGEALHEEMGDIIIKNKDDEAKAAIARIRGFIGGPR